MITAQGHSQKDGHPTMTVGLTDKEVEGLKEGRVLRLDSDDNPGVPDGWRVFIVWGADSKAILRRMKQGIVPGTQFAMEEPGRG